MLRLDPLHCCYVVSTNGNRFQIALVLGIWSIILLGHFLQSYQYINTRPLYPSLRISGTVLL